MNDDCPPLKPIPHVFQIQTDSGLLRRVERDTQNYTLVVQALEFRTPNGWIIAGQITVDNKLDRRRRVRYRRRIATSTGQHVSNDVTVCLTPEHLMYLVDVRLEPLETQTQQFVIRPKI